MDDWFATIHQSDDDGGVDDGVDIVSDLTLAQRMRRRVKSKKRDDETQQEDRSKRKRERKLWSSSEIENLKAGVERYGVYKNCWSKILEDEDFEFHSTRNGVDLKDKYRNLGLPERVVSGGWLKGLIREDKKKKKKKSKKSHKRPRLIIVDEPVSPVKSPYQQTQLTQPTVEDDDEEDYSEIPKPLPRKERKRYQQTQLTQPTVEDDDEEDYSEMPKLPLTKEQKKAQKKLQRENKKLFAKLQKIADKRRTGQYSMEQIRIIMEDSFSKTEQAISLVEALVNRITGNDAETDSESKAVMRMSDDLIETCKRSLKQSIWWEQRVELQPEEIDALKRNIVSESDLLKTQSKNPGQRNVVVWMDAKECFKLLFESPRGSDEIFIRDVISRQSMLRMDSERLVILIFGIKAYVHKILVQVQNRTSNTTYSRVPSMAAVESAVMQLYIRSGIDVQMLETYQECARYLVETTIVNARAMAPSSDSGRFSGIRKSKSTLDPSSDHKAYNTGDVWLRHLECIPGLSRKKARNVATRFPTLSSLLSHYNSLSTDQERSLALESCISAGRKERTLSARIYKVFTSLNADEAL